MSCCRDLKKTLESADVTLIAQTIYRGKRKDIPALPQSRREALEQQRVKPTIHKQRRTFPPYLLPLAWYSRVNVRLNLLYLCIRKAFTWTGLSQQRPNSLTSCTSSMGADIYVLLAFFLLPGKSEHAASFDGRMLRSLVSLQPVQRQLESTSSVQCSMPGGTSFKRLKSTVAGLISVRPGTGRGASTGQWLRRQGIRDRTMASSSFWTAAAPARSGRPEVFCFRRLPLQNLRPLRMSCGLMLQKKTTSAQIMDQRFFTDAWTQCLVLLKTCYTFRQTPTFGCGLWTIHHWSGKVSNSVRQYVLDSQWTKEESRQYMTVMKQKFRAVFCCWFVLFIFFGVWSFLVQVRARAHVCGVCMCVCLCVCAHSARACVCERQRERERGWW